jgi:chemotaxis protein CheD
VIAAEVGTAVYLHPGQLVASKEPCVVTTILGSCVSVCVFDPERRVGGMNHFVLPESFDKSASSARFAPAAHEDLLARILELGASHEKLRAKLFGGAFIFSQFKDAGHADREQPLGLRNVAAARQLLLDAGIPVVAEDVGGGRGRKVVFHTGSGEAWVKTL